MKVRELLLLFILFFAPSLTTSLRAVEHTGEEEEGAKGGLEVKYQNDLISMNVVNYPLRNVLDEVTNKTGLKITIFGPLDEKISARLDNLSLDKALSKIIGNKANFVFYYSQKASGESSPVLKLAEVKVYPQAKGRYAVIGETSPQAPSVESPSIAAAKVPQTTRDDLKRSSGVAGEGMDKDKVSEELFVALRSKDGDVRESAAYALAEVGDKRAVEPLIKSLGDENSWVRESAAYALAEIGDKRAVEPLIKSLSDENSWVRESAVRALGELRDEEAIEPLKKLLDDEDEDVSDSAAKVLKQMTGVDYKGSPSSE